MAALETEPTTKSSDDDSPIEEIRPTVSSYNDPSLPMRTFRIWFLGLLSCGRAPLFLNTFFQYRAELLFISMISV
jgi:hypothetical protein